MASHRRCRRHLLPAALRRRLRPNREDARQLPNPPQWVASARALRAIRDAGEELTYREVRLLAERVHGFPNPRGRRPRRGW